MTVAWKCVDCGYEDSERSLICPNCATDGELMEDEMLHSGMHLSSLTLNAINAEYTRAHLKHKGWTPKSVRMSDGERLAILMEEVGEVARAVTYDNRDSENLVAELIQVAAMAGAWAEYAMNERDAFKNGTPNHQKENGIRVHKEFGPAGSVD